jgi:hypothetical protein
MRPMRAAGEAGAGKNHHPPAGDHTMIRRTLPGLFASLLIALTCAVTVQSDEDLPNGFVSLFDGQTLDGWSGDERFWSVKDGAIVAHTTPEVRPRGNTFLIWTGGELVDFELKLRYRIDSPRANSGVQVRSEHLGDHVVRGYQLDIATDDWMTGIFYEERGRGVLARRGQRLVIDPDGTRHLERFADEGELAGHYDQSEWTEYHIVARGNHFVTKINGHKMHEATDNGPESLRRGILALQLHAGAPMTIRFKDIQLKPLGTDE